MPHPPIPKISRGNKCKWCFARTTNEGDECDNCFELRRRI